LGEKGKLSTNILLDTLAGESFDSLTISTEGNLSVLNQDLVLVDFYPDGNASVSRDEIDSLYDSRLFFQSSTSDQLEISIVRKGAVYNHKELIIRPVDNAGVFPTYHNAFIILLVLLGMFFISVKVTFPKKYEVLFTVYKSFSFRTLEPEAGRQRFFEQDNLLFAGLYTFLSAIMLFMLFTLGAIETNSFFQTGNPLFVFSKVWLLTIGLFIGKLILVSGFSALYKISGLSAVYMKEMINLSILMVLLMLLINYGSYLILGEIDKGLLTVTKYTLVFLYLIRIVFLHFKILRLSGFTNLYLFSYFCATEIFPFLIGFKYFF
jgi:hypothetical protein